MSADTAKVLAEVPEDSRFFRERRSLVFLTSDRLETCPGTSSIPTMELVPVPLVPTTFTKRVYKAVEVVYFKGGHETLKRNQ